MPVLHIFNHQCTVSSSPVNISTSLGCLKAFIFLYPPLNIHLVSVSFPIPFCLCIFPHLISPLCPWSPQWVFIQQLYFWHSPRNAVVIPPNFHLCEHLKSLTKSGDRNNLLLWPPTNHHLLTFIFCCVLPKSLSRISLLSQSFLIYFWIHWYSFPTSWSISHTACLFHPVVSLQDTYKVHSKNIFYILPVTKGVLADVGNFTPLCLSFYCFQYK
jgi:hypothetical protein